MPLGLLIVPVRVTDVLVSATLNAVRLGMPVGGGVWPGGGVGYVPCNGGVVKVSIGLCPISELALFLAVAQTR